MVLFSVFTLDVNSFILHSLQLAFDDLSAWMHAARAGRPRSEYSTLCLSILLLKECRVFVSFHYWKLTLTNIFCTCFLVSAGSKSACIFSFTRQCPVARQNFLHSYRWSLKYNICQSEGCEILSYGLYNLHYSNYQKGTHLFK